MKTTTQQIRIKFVSLLTATSMVMGMLGFTLVAAAVPPVFGAAKAVNTTADDFASNGSYALREADQAIDADPGGVGTPVLWLKADMGVTGNPTVTGWTDQSSNNTFTVNGTPTIATVINYNPVVTFNGSTDFLLGNTPVTFTEAFMAGTTFGGTGRPLAGDGTVSAGCGAYLFASLAGNFYTGDADPNYIRTTTADPGGYRVLNSSLNSGTTYAESRLAVNGADQPITWSVYSGPLEPFYRTPILALCGNRASNTYYRGTIGEVLIYDRVLTAQERQKINSYLGIKYGVTLSSGVDYVDSNGTVVWDKNANAGYYHDVAGIGRDDSSSLDQRKSLGASATAFVVVDNGGAFSADRSFLIWGHNNLTTSFGTIEGSYNHIGRVWQVQESGTVDTVSVSIPASYGAKYLLVDADGDFASGATAIALTSDSGNLTASYNFGNGQFFTFANDGPNLTPGVSVQPNPPQVGQPATLTLRITNTGGPAAGALITMTVPPGATIDQSLPSDCALNGNLIACGPMALSGPGTATFPIVMTPTVGGPMPITTTVSAQVVPPTATTTTFTVGRYYTLGINLVGSGSVAQNPTDASYEEGSIVTLTAVPSTTYSFAGWSGAVAGLTNPITVTMDANKVVTATFDRDADLAISRTVEIAGFTAVITLTAQNLGPWAVTGAVVSDTFPTAFTSATWTCAGTACGATSGVGDLRETLGNLAVGGMVTFTVRTGLQFVSAWTDIAEISTPAGYTDLAPSNNRATTSRYSVILPMIYKSY